VYLLDPAAKLLQAGAQRGTALRDEDLLLLLAAAFIPDTPPSYPTHPSWDIEMSLVYSSCPLIPWCTATPPLPLSHP